MNDGMCACCGVRPIAGYVNYHGIYLERFCLKCWQKGSETIILPVVKHPVRTGNQKGAKS